MTDEHGQGRFARTAAERAAYREFVRRHHPDVGGDPERFVAGLAAFTDRADTAVDDSRYDAPVEIVDRGRGLHRIVNVVREHRAKKRRGPRVR